jgi:prepilin peptidase CpaA
MNAYQIAVVGIVLVAVAWDLSTRRIPNLLTFGAALAGIAVHAYASGWSGAGLALAGWCVGAACFLPVFLLGGMGAGDVKLLAGIGAWLGPIATVWVALFSGIAGGVLGMVVALLSGYLSQAFVNISCVLMEWRVSGPRPVAELTLSSHKGPRLAYAVPMFAGLMVTLWLK